MRDGAYLGCGVRQRFPENSQHMRDPIDYYTNNLVPIVIEQSARGERS